MLAGTTRKTQLRKQVPRSIQTRHACKMENLSIKRSYLSRRGTLSWIEPTTDKGINRGEKPRRYTRTHILECQFASSESTNHLKSFSSSDAHFFSTPKPSSKACVGGCPSSGRAKLIIFRILIVGWMRVISSTDTTRV